VVITEDSCYYVGPNGDPWHNHVCRDYIPNQSGTVLTVPAGGLDSVVQSFTINSNWDEERCKIVVYAQGTTMMPADSSYPAYQEAEVSVLDLVGVEEQKPVPALYPKVNVVPNPSLGKLQFRLTTQAETPYRLEIYNAGGRLIKELAGVANGEIRLAINEKIGCGIYLYRFITGSMVQTGKLTVSK